MSTSAGRASRSMITGKLLNTTLLALNVAGHAALGVFLTNTRLIGMRESPAKSPLMALNLVGWPIFGLLQALGTGGFHSFARSLLRPFSPGWVWRALFTAIGARWLAQEVYRHIQGRPTPAEVLSSHVEDADMREAVIEAEGLTTRGLRGFFNKVNQIYSLQIVTHELEMSRLPTEFDGFTVVQVSDIHYGHFTSAEFVRRVVDAAIGMSPDLIALTGDYQTYERDIPTVSRLLASLGEWSARREGVGLLAVLGNHDTEAGTAHVSDALRSAGIEVLNNRHARLHRGGASLYIVGVTDPWSLRADLPRATQGIPAGSFTILLAHEPDFVVQLGGAGIDLQLSGHNHGGQVKLPLLGPVLVSSRYGRRYAEGFYKLGATLMYVTRGLGGHPPVRWGSKPELTRLVLHSG